ncbi:MAG: hypothetical protein ACOX2L_09830 [Anaerolineae bacterium]|jgi:hypothetical protein|nr:hypothetical protein [Chloroflexota bacterium]
MRQLLKHVLSFQDVDWWVLAGGIALNLGIALLATILGAYLAIAPHTAEQYALMGPPVMLLAVFLASLGAGALIARMAYQVPLRHAFIGSIGGAGAFIVGAVVSLNYMLLILALVCILGNLNGAILGLPKPHYRG